MLDNLFSNASTVGSHDNNPKASTEERAVQMQNLEQRVQNLEQQNATNKQPKSKGKKWGKFKKFFTAVIQPILIFIPNFINAVANIMKVAKPDRA